MREARELTRQHHRLFIDTGGAAQVATLKEHIAAQVMAVHAIEQEASVKVGLQAKHLRAGWHNDYLRKVLNS